MAKSKSKYRRKSKTTEKLIQIYGGILVTLNVIILLHESTGFLGEFLFKCTHYLFGDFVYVYLFLFMCFGIYLILIKSIPPMDGRKVAGISIIMILLMYFSAMQLRSDNGTRLTGKYAFYQFINNSKSIYNLSSKAYGGFIGMLLYSAISLLVSYVGAMIVGVLAALCSIILLVDFDKFSNLRDSYKDLQQKTKDKSDKKKKEKEAKKTEKERQKQTVVTKPSNQDYSKLIVDNASAVENEKLFDTNDNQFFNTGAKPVVNDSKKESVVEPVKVDSLGFAEDTNYKKPSISRVLTKPSVSKNSSSNKTNATKKSEQLIDILDTYGVPCTIEQINIGPSVTKFEVKPQSGIRVSKVTTLAEDIKLGLAVTDVRIEAPVPGKSVIGIEIPNVERNNVSLYELLEKTPAKYDNKPLLIALGKDLSGENVYAEIDKMPHMLIAGSTGSGKSVCINSIISTLLIRTTPSEVRLLLIDPKKVEFTPYHNVPHLVGPVITDANEASKALGTIVEIMDNRYELFRQNQVRNITEYNAKAKDPANSIKPLYNIVVIIDELADLMVQNKNDVESNIQRITQLARASGIHLIVATQRPSTDVITGTIKTNIPSRIAFAVSSAIDSRIILDQTGAETLLGNGDMLFIPIGESTPKRVQGVYVSDEEIRKITEFVCTNGEPTFDDAFVVSELTDENGYVNSLSADPLYDRVKQMVITTQKASTSSIQRYFGIGYNRAARIMDSLELEGVIGPQNGSKPRDVLIKNTDNNDMQ